MRSPARVSSLVAALLALVITNTAVDAATFFLPERDLDAEHAPVIAQLEALGIDQFHVPTHATTSDLWALIPTHQHDIDLVWSAAAAPPPFEKLKFAATFRTKLNHIPGSPARLTNHDLFYQHIHSNQQKKGLFYFNFVPQHLVLPRDQADMPKVFAAAAQRVENEFKKEDDAFIYQRFLVREVPATGNDDALLPATVITSNDELLAVMNAKHHGKNVEVTQYMEPYLIDGHKVQLGFYVVIASVDPLRIYYYGHPQIKIAKTAYPTRLTKDTDPSAYNFNDYIAPWDFPDLQKLYYELPSIDRTGTNAWSVLKKYLLLHGLDTSRLQKEIDAAIVTAVLSSRGYFQAKIRALARETDKQKNEGHTDRTDLDESFFELLRFDMELDDLGKPWLTRIHANPSMAPHTTVFGTDAAIKNHLLFDLVNLVGVHPQAKPSFDKVFVAADATYCATTCDGQSRVWDATCWSCPGGFAPYVARRVFDAKNEYARRGGFKLVYPSLDPTQDYTKALDNPLSEYDLAWHRYIQSLGMAYTDRQDVPVYHTVLLCAYREHCSDHGDCVNGQCVCDDAYEGATCYVPKDLAREKRLKEEKAAADKRAKESWMGNLWNRAPVPAPMAEGARGDGAVVNNKAAPEQELSQSGGGGFSGGGMLFGTLFVGIFAYGGYQVYVAHYGGDAPVKSS